NVLHVNRRVGIIDCGTAFHAGDVDGSVPCRNLQIAAYVLDGCIGVSIADNDAFGDVLNRYPAVAVLHLHSSGNVSNFHVAVSIRDSLISGEVFKQDASISIIEMNCRAPRYMDGQRTLEALPGRSAKSGLVAIRQNPVVRSFALN